MGRLVLYPISFWSGGVEIKVVVTRCQILRRKFTKFDFGGGSAPDPAGELTALPRTPCWIYGDILLRAEKGGKGKGEELRRRDSIGPRFGPPHTFFIVNLCTCRTHHLPMQASASIRNAGTRWTLCGPYRVSAQRRHCKAAGIASEGFSSYR